MEVLTRFVSPEYPSSAVSTRFVAPEYPSNAVFIRVGATLHEYLSCSAVLLHTGALGVFFRPKFIDADKEGIFSLCWLVKRVRVPQSEDSFLLTEIFREGS